MEFRNLFDKKNIFRLLAFAIIIFLSLPIIFPEKNDFKILNKENLYSREESPLPIFPKENLLDKYVNKLKKFYKMDIPVFNESNQNSNEIQGNEVLTAQNESEVKTEKENPVKYNDVDINARDLFFSTDSDDEESSSQVNPISVIRQKDNSVNTKREKILTKDGMALEPTMEGYYYKEKFYKNGTYPPNANKKHIESALSRYHSRTAKRLGGKKALYLADEQGNLTVAYVDELPNEVSTDIDTYLAQNNNQTHASYPKNTRYNTVSSRRYSSSYQDSNSDNLNNESIDNSDIVFASLRSMHAAYNLANQQIQTGQLGQGILPNPNNLIPMGNIILNQTSVAQPPIENHEDDIYCKGHECDNSFRIAPIDTNINDIPASDLDAFYHSLCSDSCPYSQAYNQNPDRPLDLDFSNNNSIKILKEEIAKSDKKIIEIAYINPNKENEELLTSLQEMSLINKNGEPVEIRLRGVEKIGTDTSFGDKMVGPFKNNITRDLKSNDESNEVSYETLVERYNEVDENVQDNIAQNPTLQYYKEFYPNLNFNPPVAFVERSKDKNFFIINNTDIPRGYVKDIPEWKQYKKDDGKGPYYKVPKKVLFNPPSELTIIAVQNGKNKSINLENGHPVGNISKKVLQNLNFENVKSTKTEIVGTQINTIIYNATKLQNNKDKKNKD